jgi:hypothetical protein
MKPNDDIRPVHDWRTLFYVSLDSKSLIKSLWLGWLLITWASWDGRHIEDLRASFYPWGSD